MKEIGLFHWFLLRHSDTRKIWREWYALLVPATKEQTWTFGVLALVRMKETCVKQQGPRTYCHFCISISKHSIWLNSIAFSYAFIETRQLQVPQSLTIVDQIDLLLPTSIILACANTRGSKLNYCNLTLANAN